MVRQLSEEEKRKISRFLSSGKGTPGDETPGESIKKKLKLSDAEYEELESEIDKYMTNFFSEYLGE